MSALVEDVLAAPRSVGDHVREINALEQAIARPDGEADALRWRQAEHVAALKASGLSLRAIAGRWINGQTGKPHDHTHVYWVLKVFSQLNTIPRPNFLAEYNRISNASRFRIGNGDDEWFTDPAIIEAARSVLRQIDLDPASCPAANAVIKATRFFTIEDDGLSQPWEGKVWLNPPYSRAKIGPFVVKVVKHVKDGSVTDAIVFTLSDTSTKWFARLYRHADSVCFPSGRLKFWKPDRVARDPAVYASAVFYFGPDPRKFDEQFARFVWRGEEDR